MAVALFAYRRGSSALHKAPAALKIALLFSLCLVVFAGPPVETFSDLASWPALAPLVLGLVASLALFFLSGAHFSSVVRVRFVLVFGLFVTTTRMIHIPPRFDAAAVAYGVSYTLRFFAASLASQVVFETTSPVEISRALEEAEEALSKLIPPVKKVHAALALSLAINFIPAVFATWNKVSLAARARGGYKAGAKVCSLGRQFEALFSCLLRYAEVKRMAILNRSCQNDLGSKTAI